MRKTRSSSKMTDIIKHIIKICKFPDDSTMVEFIQQEGWASLTDVLMISMSDFSDFKTVDDKGMYKAAPMKMHLRKFRGFLLYYHRKCRDLSTQLVEDDVLDITVQQFNDYCSSMEFHDDLEAGLVSRTPKSTPFANNHNNDELTASEFRRGIKRDKSHYSELKEDKYFNVWNRGFVATAFMHHTQFVLDEEYIPKTPTEQGVFTEMQIFMYAVFEEKLKTDKGKSLVSKFESTRNAQSLYTELLRHAKSSTAAQLSGDTLLTYITGARFPGNWRGKSHAFVLHWREQVSQYEKLELEEFPPKQKLRMLQNAVGDVADLSNVKQLSDQVVARGRVILGF
jgi:hypothetical protein